MISCAIPDYCNNEIQYTLNYVLTRLFHCKILFKASPDNQIVLSVNNKKELRISSCFFEIAHDNWLTRKTLPTQCQIYEHNTCVEDNINILTLPVIYGEPNLTVVDASIHCDIDILGTIFFLLSRYEEAVDGAILDKHKRFPATSSIAHKYGFLERPLADEYIEFLSTLMLNLWPELELKEQSFKQFVTCDVDWPFDPVRRSFKATLRVSLGLIKRKRPFAALSLWRSFFSYKINIKCHDINREMLSWIMDKNESVGNKVAFYFITEMTDAEFDSNFNLDSDEIRELIREIISRGHEVGLHPGYKCFNNAVYFRRSANKLKNILTEVGEKQPNIGGRMHYLMWDAKVTPKLWDDNGFDYDSTLAFADRAGFRCGTCHPFPMYDLLNRKALKVIQRPLINMECTIISELYEGLGYGVEAKKRFHFFKSIVKKNKGEYVLLWHNTHFKGTADKSIYNELITNTRNVSGSEKFKT